MGACGMREWVEWGRIVGAVWGGGGVGVGVVGGSRSEYLDVPRCHPHLAEQ